MTAAPENPPPSNDAVSTTVTETPSISKDEDAKADSYAEIEESPTFEPRAVIGRGMHDFSALINDNIIAARYGIFATIGLLTAYGISNTPLFFRYRAVAEIPRTYFKGRRRLYCRVIGVPKDAKNASGTDASTIRLRVRHLSPIGMLLPTSWFEFFFGFSPSKKKDIHSKDLLTVQIAGIQTPPLSGDSSYDLTAGVQAPSVPADTSYDPHRFLERLAREHTLVSCSLLGRMVVTPGENRESGAADGQEQEQQQQHADSIALGDEATTKSIAAEISSDSEGHQVALCRLAYRPGWQLFATDIAEKLVEVGKANPASSLLNSNSFTDEVSSTPIASNNTTRTKIIDASKRLRDIRRDVEYLDKLQRLESRAAQKSMGMWAVPEVRALKPDVVEEAEFEAKAGLLRKVWRMIRG